MENGREKSDDLEQMHVERLVLVGAHVIRLFSRTWFDGLFEPSAQQYLAPLLIGIYLSYASGLLPTKRHALRYMRATHGKTAQRYISLAEQHGLLTIHQSKIDQRVDWLLPTPKLIRLVEMELEKLLEDLHLISKFISAPKGVGSLVTGVRPFLYDVLTGEPVSALVQDDGLLHEIPDAVSRFTETIRLAPENYAAHRERGHRFLFEGEHQKALTDFETLAKLQPAWAEPFELLARVHSEMERFDQAIEDLTEAIRLNPTYYQNYEDRGGLLFAHAKDFQRAAADFGDVIRYGPRGPIRWLAHLSRAKCYVHLGRTREAIEDLHAALEMNPMLDQAKELLAGISIEGQE